MLFASCSKWMREAADEALGAGWGAKAHIKGTFKGPKSAEAELDASCAVAFEASKALGASPKELAERLALAFNTKAQGQAFAFASGPGHVSIRFEWPGIKAALKELASGSIGDQGAPKSVLLEYVSSNPTGPLHAGHGRGAALGHALENLFRKAGWKTKTEYYMNDAGRQTAVVALSCVWRALSQDLGDVPTGLYKGAYMDEEALAAQSAGLLPANYLAKAKSAIEREILLAKDEEAKAQAAGAPENKNKDDEFADRLGSVARSINPEAFEALRNHLVARLGSLNINELKTLGIEYDRVFSEKTLWDQGLVEAAGQKLIEAGWAYEKDGALFFASSRDGDTHDRVLRRSNGAWTYFAADVAYHADKLGRDEESLALNLWGADHHGYAPRVKAALKALGFPASRLEIRFCQFANLTRAGKPAVMSTRAGSFLKLLDLTAEMGASAFAWWMCSKKPESHLEIDLDKTGEMSKKNPVFCAQYAAARMSQAMAKIQEDNPGIELCGHLEASGEEGRKILAKALLLEEAAGGALSELSPHRISEWALEWALAFHSLYERQRFNEGSQETRSGWLEALGAARGALAGGLGILAVDAPHSMPRLNETEENTPKGLSL